MNIFKFSFFPLFILLAIYFGSAKPQLASLFSTTSCDQNSSPIFVFQHNTTNGALLRSVAVGTFIECADLCSESNECVGIDYVDGQCNLLGRSDSPYQVVKEAAAEGNGIGSRLLYKSCVKSERICASPFHFDAHQQKILVGFAREVVAADSIQTCLSACLNAFDNFGFECESVMYYPVDSECILNTEDRLDRPDLFVDEHTDQVIYFDNNCAGSQCYAPYVTQYVAVEGKMLHDELDRTVQGIDQTGCEELCTQRLAVISNEEPKLNFNCKSFMYNAATRTCVLSDERSKPLGRATLIDDPNYVYFEKKCFASPKTCRNAPSFTRVPQMLLVGFASFVMENVPSSTMCLDQCTNPPPETGEKFVCKSVMYYYNEQECILNAESRQSKPDLFIPEEDDFVVDYFDIKCHLDAEKCIDSGDQQLKYYTVRTLNAALPEGDGSLHVFATMNSGIEECRDKCVASSPEKCRSFNYNKITKTCNLMYLDGRGSLRPQAKPSVDLYDLHCLEPPKHTSHECLNKDGVLYSRYLYTKQQGVVDSENSSIALSRCLNLCSEKNTCEGVNYNRRDGHCTLFAKVDQEVGEQNEHIDFYRNLCQSNEVDSGLSSAIHVPKQTEVSIQSPSGASLHKPSIRKPSGSGDTPKEESKTGGDQDHQHLPAKHEKQQPHVLGVANQPAKRPLGPSATPQPEPIASLSIKSVSDVSNAVTAVPVMIPADSIQTICNYEGIKVQIKHESPFTGVIFVKNKYDSCRVEVSNTDTVTLVLGLPTNFGMKPISLNTQPNPPKKKTDIVAGSASAVAEKTEIRRKRRQTERDCGLIDMDNGTYKTVVVVQTNNLGIPGLVTSMDQLYEVSCNYSSMLGGKVTAATNLTVHGPQPALIQPRGKIELGNPVLMQMTPVGAAQKSNNSLPLIQAKLGDILELSWEIMAMDDELDFFIRDCHAEPGVNPNGAREKLQLIEKGCPTPAVSQKLIPNPIQVRSSAVKVAHLQAFRFDSSSTIRITCHLELCKKECKPVKCQLAGGEQESWGRKKRDLKLTKNEIMQNNTFEYMPRYSQATTSLVIIDPLQQISDPLFASSQYAAHSSVSRLSQNEHIAASKAISSEPHIEKKNSGLLDERCMSKWTVGGILGTLSALILFQSAVVGKNLILRIPSFSNNKNQN